jgi:hypothetical protein
MIRRTGDKKLFQCGGERRKIGRLAKASLTAWIQAGRYEPEGLRNPGGERRLENKRRVPKSDLATGFVCGSRLAGRIAKAGAGAWDRTGQA